MKQGKPEAYWERAGEVGYAEAMYAAQEVERHVNNRLRQIAVEMGKKLGLNEQSHVIDLGCGDGAFANTYLIKHFKAVDGFDLSAPAIERAKSLASAPNVHFYTADVTKLNFLSLPKKNYDGAFLYGILHHVKQATPQVLSNLREVTKRVIVLEPNGNNLIRKLLERTAVYKAAGEESFRTKEMEQIFQQAGYHTAIWRRYNMFPNFTPKLIFQLLKHIEPWIENAPLLRALCTVNMWGFVANM